MAVPIIKVDNAEVTYNKGAPNEYKALRSESLEIYEGEYIILFGPSGCGKSTLLYCILGILPTTDGKLLVKGEDIYGYDSQQMVNYQRNTIGIIYQSFNLISSISVLDNVSLPQIFAGIDPEVRAQRGIELLKRFGVGHIADKLPTHLSGGQMQRVAVARSLINDPHILLADEPVGNLDSISAEQVMNTLEQINLNEKKTVILVTHDAKYLPYAHRIYYMKDGGVDREVVNPSKTQIKKVAAGSTIVTEIETLARFYPYSTVPELRVKSIINYLTQKLDFDQLARLEGFVEEVINGRMGEDIFFKLLHTSFLNGGVGLDEQLSRDMAHTLRKIMEEAQDVRRYRKNMSVDLAGYYQQKFTKRLKAYIEEEWHGQVDPEQEKNLEEIITDRIFGVLRKDSLQKRLQKTVIDGGLNLDEPASLAITRYLEKLLAQGITSSMKKE